MRTIGIRVTPTKIYYTIIFEDNKIIHEYLTIPKALDNDIPRQLSFVRTALHSIICEYDIHYAGIRTIEGNAKTWNRFRVNLEGVIQEIFSDSTIINYFTGTKSSMKSRLRLSNAQIAENLSGHSNTYCIENWNIINKNHRESFLVAKSALHSIRRISE